jgi:Domain of unknown function (DUF4184)
MPFTLAHPAAILPFRRFCPRFLSFPALIAGSVSPDASYFFGRFDVGPFAHHPLKGFLFGVPAGLVILAVFYLLRSPALKMLPQRYREIFEPLRSHPLGTPLVIFLSLVLGVATHIIWDNFTHNHSWMAQHVVFLHEPLFLFGTRTIRVVHILSYICSFLGVFWLCLTYSRWRATEPPLVQWRDSLFVGALVFPITAIHHLMNTFAGLLLVGLLCLLLILFAVLRIAKPVNPESVPASTFQKQT